MKDFNVIRESVEELKSQAKGAKKLKVRVNNKEYEVIVEEIK